MGAIIVGAGSYGEVYYQYLRHDGGINIIGFTDDNTTKKEVLGVPVLTTTRDFKTLQEHQVTDIFCSIGHNKLRMDLLSAAQQHNFIVPNYFHSTSIISDDCRVGHGVSILAGTIVMPRVEIGNYVMISVGSRIIHHALIANGAFISNGVNLGANVLLDECAFVGMGATIMTGVKRVGKNAIVGAGAVVIKDVPDNAIVAGVPAKIIKYIE